MSPSASRPSAPIAPHESVVEVKVHGWTWLDRAFLLITVGIFPLGLLLVIFVSGPPPTVDLTLRLVVIVALLGAGYLFAEALVSVRSVRVDSQGVTFGFLFHSEHREWRDLGPSRLPPQHGGWGIVARRPTGRLVRQRGYAITIAQARVIVAHPSCPKWEIPEATRMALQLGPIEA